MGVEGVFVQREDLEKRREETWSESQKGFGHRWRYYTRGSGYSQRQQISI
jgi:hypothetical protein